MSPKLKEVHYKCNNPRCGHEQTIVYFYDDQPLPVTCCVQCRAGFDPKPPGMYPTGEPNPIHDEPIRTRSLAEAIQ
jgi:hypothetical protein